MMARMLSQLPLPLLPPGAAEIAPGVGVLAGGNPADVLGIFRVGALVFDMQSGHLDRLLLMPSAGRAFSPAMPI